MPKRGGYGWERVPVIICLAMLLVCLPAGGCGGGTQGASGEAEEEEAAGFAGGEAQGSGRRLKVAATIFPYYDFVRQVAGDLVELKMVVPAGMDSHSFEPTPADMRAIQEADVLVMNGGAMEYWVGQVLDAVDAPDLTVVTMMDYVDAVQEEIVEGMEDEEHDHEYAESSLAQEDHSSGSEHAGRLPEAVREERGVETGRTDDGSDLIHDGGEAAVEYDEHVWTSPVNAMEFVRVIADTLSREDPAHAAEYAAGAKRYLAELESIHEGFLAVSEARKRDTIVIGDKFPFRYLTEEYGIDYRAAFSGCSTDTEPAARTIAYLIDRVREGQIPVVYYLELSSHRVAEIIGEETGAKPLLLHSCHNVTRADLNAGVTYARLMRDNIENLRKGLDE